MGIIISKKWKENRVSREGADCEVAIHSRLTNFHPQQVKSMKGKDSFKKKSEYGDEITTRLREFICNRD